MMMMMMTTMTIIITTTTTIIIIIINKIAPKSLWMEREFVECNLALGRLIKF